MKFNGANVNILRIITFSFLVGHSILTISDFNSFRFFWDTLYINFPVPFQWLFVVIHNMNNNKQPLKWNGKVYVYQPHAMFSTIKFPMDAMQNV